MFVDNPEQNFGIFTDSININGIKVFSVGKLKYNPRVISNGIAIKKNKPYRLNDRKKPIIFLMNFKYSNILQ